MNFSLQGCSHYLVDAYVNVFATVGSNVMRVGQDKRFSVTYKLTDYNG